ncbi:site-specific integrase [Spirillospora sp. CA-253888]
MSSAKRNLIVVATTSAEAALPQPAEPDLNDTVSSRVADRISASVPESTRRAYTKDWAHFSAWCTATGRTALPATDETLAEYASARADQGRAPATISRSISVVRVIHRLNGHAQPDALAARAVIKSYRAERAAAGQANERRAEAVQIEQLRAMVAACQSPTDDPRRREWRPPATVARDRVVLVLGWAMMARRSELEALNISDVTEATHGLEVMVRMSKTDHLSDGSSVAIPYGSDPETCPVRLVRAWLQILAEYQITTGPLIRQIDQHGNVRGRLSGQSISRVVTRAAERAGLDPATIRGHSLRAGGATGAYLGGADLVAITRHGRWTDGSTAVLRYIRDVDRWAKNPMHRAGL